MNERIEHCLYQAGLTAQGCWDELDDYAKHGIEKFAELIVRKCMSLTERCLDGNDVFALNGAEIIAEHFGVEE